VEFVGCKRIILFFTLPPFLSFLQAKKRKSESSFLLLIFQKKWRLAKKTKRKLLPNAKIASLSFLFSFALSSCQNEFLRLEPTNLKDFFLFWALSFFLDFFCFWWFFSFLPRFLINLRIFLFLSFPLLWQFLKCVSCRRSVVAHNKTSQSVQSNTNSFCG